MWFVNYKKNIKIRKIDIYNRVNYKYISSLIK